MRHGDSLPSPILASSSVCDVLGWHHREVEAGCLDMMNGVASDARGLMLRWGKVEHDLLQHMAAEERIVFPAYQHADPKNIRDLVDEHAVLRVGALEIGIAIHRHMIRSEHLQQFVDKLRAHARHEEASLYRWAQRNLDHDQRHTLRALVR
jgi:hemerythrin superfamily protein